MWLEKFGWDSLLWSRNPYSILDQSSNPLSHLRHICQIVYPLLPKFLNFLQCHNMYYFNVFQNVPKDKIWHSFSPQFIYSAHSWSSMAGLVGQWQEWWMSFKKCTSHRIFPNHSLRSIVVLYFSRTPQLGLNFLWICRSCCPVAHTCTCISLTPCSDIDYRVDCTGIF